MVGIDLLVSATLVQFGYPYLNGPYYFTSGLSTRPLIRASQYLTGDFVLTTLYDFYGRPHNTYTSANN